MDPQELPPEITELDEQALENPAVEGDALEQEREAKEVMKIGQEQRAGFLKRMLTSEFISNILNLVPVGGSIKMLLESIAGGTLSGEELSGKGRIIHTAVGAACLLLDFTGVGEAADAAVVAGKSTALLGRLATKLAEKGAAKAAAVVEKTIAFMTQHPELLQAAEKFAEQKIKEYRAQHA